MRLHPLPALAGRHGALIVLFLVPLTPGFLFVALGVSRFPTLLGSCQNCLCFLFVAFEFSHPSLLIVFIRCRRCCRFCCCCYWRLLFHQGEGSTSQANACLVKVAGIISKVSYGTNGVRMAHAAGEMPRVFFFSGSYLLGNF